MPLAQDLFLGNDLLAWLMLAFGGALVVGNAAALVRPPRSTPRGPRRDKPPLGPALTMIVLGAVIFVWALATLLR